MLNKADFDKKTTMSRRKFVKLGAMATATAAVAPSLVGCSSQTVVGGEPAVAQAGERTAGAEVKPSICWHNCGGRCQIKGYVKDGVVVRFGTDNEGPDTPDDLQARACLKGRSQRQRLYHPDRLKYPMKRVGERGGGKWERISWDEAYDTMAKEIRRIIDTYGNESLYLQYACGSYGALNSSNSNNAIHRLFNVLGGYLSYFGNYSQANYMYAVPYMFGNNYSGSSPTTFPDAKLMVMFGDNPACTRVGGFNSAYYLKLAKEAGTKIIIIDPRHSDTVSTFADQWIPKKEDRIQGADATKSTIKLIFNCGGNILINQHADSGRTAAILRDTSKCEFLVGFDNFMTPSMQYCDLALPAVTQFEVNDVITRSMGHGVAYYGQKLVEPMYECKTIHEIGLALAERLGVLDKFDDGKSEEDYLREFVGVSQKNHADFPSYEVFREKGIYKTEAKKVVAYKDFVADPEANPLPTPSGKIEIFSKDLYDINNPLIPAVPKYMPAAEGPQGALKDVYPIQLIGHHTKRRVHSTFDNMPWLEEAEAQRLWINPQDAAKRGIKDGDLVKIYNDRGAVKVKAKVTPRLIPGVASLPQGAWYTPDKDGVDQRGCVNTLTTWDPTPLSKGNPQHTNLVQIEKA